MRQHAAVPAIDVRTWRLRIEGAAVERPVDLGFDDLLRLPSRSVTVFIECAGNGRAFFNEFMGKVASGTQWRFGRIGVAEWTGVPLGAVLDLARSGGTRRATSRTTSRPLQLEPLQAPFGQTMGGLASRATHGEEEGVSAQG